MPRNVSSTPTTFARFCRHCGYNLHGLPANRCPECGRTFDPNNPKTFSKSSGALSRRRWANRIIVAFVALIMLIGVGGLSLWYPWHREQAAVRMVQRCGGVLTTETVGPRWLQRLLGKRGGFLLVRVDSICLSRSHPEADVDSDLATLEGLSGLHELRLDCTGVTDAGLVHLKSLKSLRVLDLSLTDVTDAGLEQLTSLTGLQDLDLTGMQVTDAGIENLMDLKGLRSLGLCQSREYWWPHVTDAGMAKLKKALPGCYIDR